MNKYIICKQCAFKLTSNYYNLIIIFVNVDMSRKSSSKKSQPVLWYQCEKCLVNITTKDRDNHEKYCPITEQSTSLSYIKDKVLYTTNLDEKVHVEETNDIPQKYLSSLIFISESAMRLCQFYIGQYVAIKISDKLFVRLIWPIPDKFLTSVFVTEEDFRKSWKNFKNSQLQIRKLPTDPEPAEEISLNFEDKLLENDESIEEITKVLKIQMRNLVYCLKNEIFLNFFNKEIVLTIEDYKLKTTAVKSLEIQFQNLNLEWENTPFFLITSTTRIKIIRKQKQLENDSLEIDSKICKSDIGGVNNILSILEENINLALGIGSTLPAGLKISRGVLLFGPSGCGKSMICEAMSNDLNRIARIIRINTNEIFSKYFGETEKNLEKYFDIAYKAFPQPALIIIEDISNICPKNESNEVIKRVSVAFLHLLDSLHFKNEASRTFVIATTGNIENLNPGLRRFGRFDSELEIPAPNPAERQDILRKHLKTIKHSLSDVEIKHVSDVTHGYVGSDLVSLIYKAAMQSLTRNTTAINSEDINYALTQVKPSAMREVCIENPNVKWEDIGGQDDLKLKLKQAIEWPLLHPEKFIRLGIKPPRGILMFGPPGCSKTMIAKALATESKVNFISIKGPELFSMWVGESERAVREVFRKARQVAPSIIFFDEIDAIGGERSSDGGNSSVKERVLTQMLTELDGVDALNNVTVVAATNRPDMCDKALLRPGRIDRIVYVGLPDAKTRKEIFSIKFKKMPVADCVCLDDLIENTEGYSGAEINAICNEAALKALEESFDATEVKLKHFEIALKIIQPRTSKELLQIYDNYLKKT